MKRFALLTTVWCLAIGACSNGTSSHDGGGGASGSAGSGGRGGTGGAGGSGGKGGTGGAIGDPVCAFAVATQPCSAEGTVCGSENCTNVCQFCNIVRCMNGVWQRIEVAPYPCFSCGPDLRCRTSLDYCFVTRGGPPPGGMTYRCAGVPTACTSTGTCACLQSEGAVTAGASCAQAGVGELTVTLDVP